MEEKKILFVIKDFSLEEKVNKLISGILIKSKFKTKEELLKKDLENIDLIISVGGDGTFLSATHFIENQLILGVNSDKNHSEGALTSISLEQLPEILKKFITNNLIIKEYTRIKVKIIKENQCTQTELALNEVYFGNINPHHPSNYNIKFKEQEEIQRSSGVIISTGTGSTAWYQAMGGKPFQREKLKLKFKVREPYCGRIHKATLIKGSINKNQVFTLTSLMHHGLISIDSIRIYQIKEKDKIEISIGIPLKVIQ